MSEWLFFNIVLPLTPIPLVYVSHWVVGRPALLPILRDGQLCFYSTSVSSIAIYDLLKVKVNVEIGQLLIGIMFLMILSTFAFGVTVICNQLNHQASQGKLALISVLSALATSILVVYTHWWLEHL